MRSELSKKIDGFFSTIAAIYLIFSTAGAAAIGIASIARASEFLSMPSWSWSVWLGCLIATGGICAITKTHRLIFIGSCFLPLAMFLLVGVQFDATTIHHEIALFQQTPKELLAPIGWFALVISPITGLVCVVLVWHNERQGRELTK